MIVARHSPRHIDPPSPGRWDWEFAIDISPFLLQGLWVTIRAVAVAIVIALVLGLFLAIARRSRLRIISFPVAAFIEFVRSTPLLVQLFFFFIAFPELTGLRLGAFRTGVLALAIHYATYTSESYRAGIENVERGQWEAATAINLSGVQTWRRVVLPQAVPTVIPALGNYVVAMFKDAPLLSAITVVELVGEARRVQGIWFRGMEPFTMAGLFFLAVSIPAAMMVRYLERRFIYERA